jgi:hypothetical protein
LCGCHVYEAELKLSPTDDRPIGAIGFEQLGLLSAILRGAEALPSLTTPVTELLSRLSSLQDY